MAVGSTMIRNGVGYAKLIFNGVISMAGNFNTKSLFSGTPYVPGAGRTARASLQR